MARSWLIAGRVYVSVVPAQAGTHTLCAGDMAKPAYYQHIGGYGSRLRGDDSKPCPQAI
jgi:hypothetical protein